MITDQNEFFKEFGVRLKSLREDAGLSQEELANQLNVPKKVIVIGESGTRSRGQVFPAKVMLPLANFFDVTLDYLFCFTDDPHGYAVHSDEGKQEGAK